MAANYGNANLSALQSCDGERTAQALSRFYANWCKGCTVAEAFLMLQVITAADPRRAMNWNMLGAWLKEIGDWTLASVCLKIAERLMYLHGLPPGPNIIANIAAMGSKLTIPDLDTLW